MSCWRFRRNSSDLHSWKRGRPSRWHRALHRCDEKNSAIPRTCDDTREGVSSEHQPVEDSLLHTHAEVAVPVLAALRRVDLGIRVQVPHALHIHHHGASPTVVESEVGKRLRRVANLVPLLQHVAAVAVVLAVGAADEALDAEQR